MTTESDAVLATIVDNWGGGGYAGATPKIQSTADIAVDRWAALDAVIVLHDTLDELHPRVNDKFVNKEYTMDIRVTSIVSEDQLKLLVEETEYLLNNTAITGFTSVYVTRKNRGSSDRGRKVYRNDVTILFKAQMSSSAIAPAASATTDMVTTGAIKSQADNKGFYTGVGDDLRIYHDGTNSYVLNTTNDLILKSTGDDVKIDSADDFQVESASIFQDITGAYVLRDADDTNANLFVFDTSARTAAIGTAADPIVVSINTYDVNAALMLGAANAAWLSCGLDSWQPQAKFIADVYGDINNVDDTDGDIHYTLNQPCNKGSLKLYVAGTAVHLTDADANNFITNTYVYGLAAGSTKDVLDLDGTDKSTVERHEDTFTAVDCSGYESIRIRLTADVLNGGALEIVAVAVKCYYA